MGIYLSGAGILGCVFWPGAGIACSQGIPPYLYPPYVNVGCLFHRHHQHYTASPSLSAHLCDSAPPTRVGECGFFKSLVVGLPYSSIFLTVLVVGMFGDVPEASYTILVFLNSCCSS